MKYLYVLLFILVSSAFFVARTEPPASNLLTNDPSTKAEFYVAELLAFLQLGKGFNYESSTVDGATVEFTNVSSRTEPKLQIESIRVSNPYYGSAEDRSTFSLELVGASLDGSFEFDRLFLEMPTEIVLPMIQLLARDPEFDLPVVLKTLQFDTLENRSTFSIELVGLEVVGASLDGFFGFDRLFLEMPTEKVLTMIQLMAKDPEFDFLVVLKTLQLDTLEIQEAYLLSEDCDLRLGALKISELANLATALLNFERVDFACDSEEVAFKFTIPYVYIDDLKLRSVYLQNLGRRFDPYMPLLGIVPTDPIGYLAESIRVSDVSANLDGVFIETDAASFSSGKAAEGNYVVSSMTPLNVRVTVGQKDSELASSVRELFDRTEISELKVEFRQEHHFDIENDRFSLPLNHNYIEVNELARINFELELEGMAGYLGGVEPVIARGRNSEDSGETDKQSVLSNMKLRRLRVDLKDYGLVDHAFQVASRHFGQSPDLLKGTVVLILPNLARNSDLRLNREEEKRFSEIVEVLSAAVRNRGTLSARFEIDDSLYDLDEEEVLRKMIFEFMTLEFVE